MKSSKLKITEMLFLAIFLISFLLAGCNQIKIDESQLPAYAKKTSEMKEAYIFAKEHPDALQGVKCYCGCMNTIKEDDDRLHTRGVIDCFLEPNGSYEIHGSNCPLCVKEALRVKELVANRIPKDKIITLIDSEFKASAGSCSTDSMMGTCST